MLGFESERKALEFSKKYISTVKRTDQKNQNSKSNYNDLCPDILTEEVTYTDSSTFLKVIYL